jgi:hypothetical protein
MMLAATKSTTKTIYSLTSLVYNDTEFIIRTEHNKSGLVLITKTTIAP